MSNTWRGDWDYSEVPAGVVLGEDVWLERKQSFARVRSHHPDALVLGDRVRVFTWTNFSVEGEGRLHVGPDAVLVGAQFMCATSIVIGARSVLSYGVVVSDADFHPTDPEQRRADCEANAPEGNRADRLPFPSRPVVIGQDVQVGVGALLLKGARVGDGAVVAAGAVVTSEVPSGMAAIGNPAVVVPLSELP